jgi:stage II sporulation protein D
MPVASGAGSFHLSAIGEKIRWGKSKLLSSPIDVASTAGLRIDGKTAVSRIRVTAVKGKLHPVAVVPLEEYVAAVSAREAPSSFHPESLSALAVSVRTYVLLSMEKPRASTHDVVASVEDQVFEGLDGVAPVYRKAAESTSGEVIGYGDSLARAVFHSTCGGRTENAKDAWGSEVPYLHSVACGDCLDSPAHKWNYRMTSKEGRRTAQSLGVVAGEDLRFDVTEKSSTGRASRVRISSGGVSREVSAAVFRKTVGYSKVKSLRMKIGSDGNGWNFTGEGYGHGVGMCQWGANGMAKNGKTYPEILARYYPGTYLARGIP